MTTVLGQLALPTVRTMRWWPLAAAGAPVLGLVLIARSADRPADAVLLIGAAALASVVVGALRDDAAVLLEAVPVSTMRRRVVRLALVGVPALLVWWGLVAVGAPGGAPGTGPLLALAGCGVAVAVWGPQRWAVLAGSAVPVVWFALDRVAAADGALGGVLGWWRTDPWPVVAVAVVACIVGRQR
jgi:hypothetical protein